MVFGQANPKRFSIYLLSPKIKNNQLASLDLKTLKPYGESLVEISDISSYLKDTHEIRFGYKGADKLLKSKESISGEFFAVFVNDEAIYTGAFLSGNSSFIYDGVYIDLEEIQGEYPTMRLKLGDRFTGTDPRSDERIFTELAKGGFLYEKLEVVGKLKKITATGKRHASWIFTFSLDSILKGKYPEKEITFEKFADFGGSKLRSLLKADETAFTGENFESNFNFEKEIILFFEVQVKSENPGMYLADFRAK
jgi:hypothetical protein